LKEIIFSSLLLFICCTSPRRRDPAHEKISGVISPVTPGVAGGVVLDPGKQYEVDFSPVRVRHFHRVHFAYPETAKTKGIEGNVELQIEIARPDYYFESPRVTVISGPIELREVAVACAKNALVCGWNLGPDADNYLFKMTIKFNLKYSFVDPDLIHEIKK